MMTSFDNEYMEEATVAALHCIYLFYMLKHHNGEMQYCVMLWWSYQQNNTVLQLPALSHSSLHNEDKSTEPRTKKPTY